MATPATHGIHVHGARRERGRLTSRTLVQVGAIAGLAGGMMMAMWQMVVGAIAQEPTAVARIDSSFWTAVTSIPSVISAPTGSTAASSSRPSPLV